MADVFISYARATRPMVEPIAEALMLEGYDVWWDEELPVHRSYTEVIQEKVGGAKAVIVAWSQDAVQSEWVRAEAEVGRNQKKLVQVLIEDAALPLPFNQTQYADLRRWGANRSHAEWRKVLASLSAIVDAPAPVFAAQERAIRKQFSSGTLRRRFPALIVLAVCFAVLIVGAATLFLLKSSVSRATSASQQAFSQRPADTPRDPDALVGAPKAHKADVAEGPAKSDTHAPAIVAAGFIFPDSDKRLLTDSDVADLSKGDLRFARNEIYARAGRIFDSPDLQQRFGQDPWYHPVSKDAAPNTEIARQNVLLIKQAEDQRVQ